MLRDLAAALFVAVQVLALGTAGQARAENEEPAASVDPNAGGSQSAPSPAPETVTPANEAPEVSSPPAAAAAPVTADPVVSAIRTKLADPSPYKDAKAEDFAALAAFYNGRGSPLWLTEMGMTAKGQAALFEIADAEEWGLDAKAFELPDAGALPASEEAQADAEIKLGFAILEYARHARGGRLVPSEVSGRFDQKPPFRDPSLTLAEIATSEAPDLYLQSLHPKHEQFARLREALAEMRKPEEDAKDEAKEPAASNDPADGSADKKKPAEKKEAAKKPPTEKDIKRVLLNMERWRWMPEDLGSTHILSNTPEFMLYVVKDGKPIYSDKILVGTSGYPTPIFSDEMETIVFNPEWIAPPTVLVENLWPHLRKKNFGMLAKHKLRVSYQGKPVDPKRVNWSKVNVRSYTFTQAPGPGNNLGKAKFLYPNEHAIYMHDTLPVRKKYFKRSVRAIGHECVRMERPDKFAEVLLHEANAMPADKIKELWDKGIDKGVTLEAKIPVHMVYFTATVDDDGKLSTFSDLYGFDRKLAAAMFGNSDGFPAPAPEPKIAESEGRSAPQRQRTAASGIAGAVQSFFED